MSGAAQTASTAQMNQIQDLEIDIDRSIPKRVPKYSITNQNFKKKLSLKQLSCATSFNKFGKTTSFKEVEFGQSES